MYRRAKMEIRQVSQNIQSSLSKKEVASPNRETNRQREVDVPQSKTKEKEESPQQIKELVDGANQFFKMTKTHLDFHLHEKLNRHYVEIRNSETNEVIKEIPSKEFLDMVAKLLELAGLIIDEKI
jgi:flagellar protein FlaG